MLELLRFFRYTNQNYSSLNLRNLYRFTKAYHLISKHNKITEYQHKQTKIFTVNFIFKNEVFLQLGSVRPFVRTSFRLIDYDSFDSKLYVNAVIIVFIQNKY